MANYYDEYKHYTKPMLIAALAEKEQLAAENARLKAALDTALKLAGKFAELANEAIGKTR